MSYKMKMTTQFSYSEYNTFIYSSKQSRQNGLPVAGIPHQLERQQLHISPVGLYRDNPSAKVLLNKGLATPCPRRFGYTYSRSW